MFRLGHGFGLQRCFCWFSSRCWNSRRLQSRLGLGLYIRHIATTTVDRYSLWLWPTLHTEVLQFLYLGITVQTVRRVQRDSPRHTSVFEPNPGLDFILAEFGFFNNNLTSATSPVGVPSISRMSVEAEVYVIAVRGARREIVRPLHAPAFMISMLDENNASDKLTQRHDHAPRRHL